MEEDEPKRPFFLIVVDEDRGGFSVEGPMTDPGSPLPARDASSGVE